MKTVLFGVIALAAIACGGSKPDAVAPSELGGQTHATAPAAQDAKAAIDKFHDTLAVRWHADPGPQRMTDTCAAMPQFKTEAEAVAAAPAPGGDAAAWTTETQKLADAVAAVAETCQAKDAAAFEPAFSRLHDAFHAVMDAAGKHKHAAGEHKH